MRKYFCEFDLVRTYNFEFSCSENECCDSKFDEEISKFINSENNQLENYLNQRINIDYLEEIKE